MWVVAATMHMEGKAKVWYEAYKLRQAVGDWPEFMDTVEAHFGVEDPPPATPIVGAAPPSVVVHASGDISPAPPTRCLTVNPKEVMDTAAEPTEPTIAQLEQRLNFPFAQVDLAPDRLEDGTQMAEALTHVGGVSLFLEIFVEPAKVVSTEPLLMELDADHVLTHVGGSSLFLELVMEATEHVVLHEQLADYVLTHVGGLSLFRELDVDTFHVPAFYKIPSWRRGGFSPWSKSACCGGLTNDNCSFNGQRYHVNGGGIEDAIRFFAAWCTCQSLLAFTHTPSAQLVLTRQNTSFFHVEQLLACRLHSSWDPGGSWFACLLQVMQLATRNGALGMLRFAGTDWICCYLTLVRRLVIYDLLQRPTQLSTQTTKSCHAFLANSSLLKSTRAAIRCFICPYQVVHGNEVTWYSEAIACLMQLEVVQLCENIGKTSACTMDGVLSTDVWLLFFWQ